MYSELVKQPVLANYVNLRLGEIRDRILVQDQKDSDINHSCCNYWVLRITIWYELISGTDLWVYNKTNTAASNKRTAEVIEGASVYR